MSNEVQRQLKSAKITGDRGGNVCTYSLELILNYQINVLPFSSTIMQSPAGAAVLPVKFPIVV